MGVLRLKSLLQLGSYVPVELHVVFVPRFSFWHQAVSLALWRYKNVHVCK